MEQITSFWDQIKDVVVEVLGIFTYEFTELAGVSISIWSIFQFFTFVILLFYLSNKFTKLLVNRILVRYNLDIGVRQSIGTITRYILIVLGMYVIITAAGINLNALTVLFGALGVGIGFGLQNIVNNFISGLIILFERPIKVGDRIEVGDVNGDVVDISARSTTVVTNDNISIIVPNSEFISSKVTNWSHNDRRIRFRFPVGVAYKEDPERVRKVLMEVMNENEGVLKNPPPDVWFDDFGDSYLNFHLMVWTIKYVQRPNLLKSQLYYAIFAKFKQHNIEIPFPQRDLHLKDGELNVSKKENGLAN
ncbi:mechanosensitive ion channel [Porifericola rhodea]|uniref:mechanosensitive ion channel family protein n=1 Tax=Porifericola rhodea TaxID=930972 RepID=UPI0026654EDB|nr:mechanosensitive ion channel domain-containing protein [Porifericola rhodea]WKN30254.1 mechanosensitive ion channel [Porifericola rhodea]